MARIDRDRAVRLAEAGRWLRQQRERRGYSTAKKFAAALGIDPSMVSNYERGATSVDDQRAAQIADVLNMPELLVREHLGLWVPAAGVPTEQDLAHLPEGTLLQLTKEIAEHYPDHPAIQQAARLLTTLVEEHSSSSAQDQDQRSKQDHDEETQSKKTG